MFDRVVLVAARPVLIGIGRRLAGWGVSADVLTTLGFGLGLFSAVLIATQAYTLALLPLLAGRLCDGLDGTVARLTAPSARGAFLDISLDFLFYASVPLAFAEANPADNALASAVLLASFIGSGSSFLAYAVMAEKQGLPNHATPAKSFAYLGGLTEGAETIACFVAMLLWPAHYSALALVFAALCAVTTLTRLAAGWRAFGGGEG
jgi:phosphatidylglycerophosphate synthase